MPGQHSCLAISQEVLNNHKNDIGIYAAQAGYNFSSHYSESGIYVEQRTVTTE